MDLLLNQHVVLISGAARGIGESIARDFATEGAKVVITDLTDASPLAAELGGVAHQGDLTNDAACAEAVRTAIASFGRLDVLVNNAGVNDGQDLEAGAEGFMRSLQKNLAHVYGLAHHALPYLKASPHGSIVNITSKVAQTGQGGTSGYAASKGGVNALTREWAVELAAFNIRVNAVAPAEVWTPMYASWIETLEDGPSTKAAIESLIPLGQRFTRPEEIAAMATFLASPRSAHTTGQIIYVDGGYTHLDRKLRANP